MTKTALVLIAAGLALLAVQIYWNWQTCHRLTWCGFR